ncbi:hypothetical protein GCM10023083_62710 [Streptomyces phyllanthi]
MVAQVPVQTDDREALPAGSGVPDASGGASVVGAAVSSDNPTRSITARRRHVVVFLAVNGRSLSRRGDERAVVSVTVGRRVTGVNPPRVASG